MKLLVHGHQVSKHASGRRGQKAKGKARRRGEYGKNRRRWALARRREAIAGRVATVNREKTNA